MQTRWELAHKRVCIISPAYGASRHRDEAEGGIEVSMVGWSSLTKGSASSLRHTAQAVTEMKPKAESR